MSSRHSTRNGAGSRNFPLQIRHRCTGLARTVGIDPNNRQSPVKAKKRQELSDRFLAAANLDLFQRVERAVSRARAHLTGVLPTRRRLQRAVPKRPRPALSGTRSVDPAMPRFWVKKNAIPVRIFDQTTAIANPASESIFEFLHTDFEFLRHRLRFRLLDEHVSGFTAAARSTLGTLESQPFGIPRQIGIGWVRRLRSVL